MTRLPFIVAALALCVSPAAAQTVRFSTNAGSFDLTLNPTNDPNLATLTDNLIANAAAGNYDNVVINRADPTPGLEVLQLGSFLSDTLVLSDVIANGFGTPNTFAPIVVDADNDGNVDFNSLSNTRGTVSLATMAGNPNSGTLSFFVNLGDNSVILDPQGFVPFAEVSDLTVVDSIFNLPQQDISLQVGVQPGSPQSTPFANIPLSEGDLVVIDSVSILSDLLDDPLFFANPFRVAAGLPRLTFPVAPSASAAAFVPPSIQQPAFIDPEASVSGVSVPEPTSLGLLVCSLLTGSARRR